MFNTLKYAKELEEAGVSRAQAETHIRILTEAMDSNFATKQDLKDLEARMHQGFQNLRHDIQSLELRMTIKLGAIVTLAMGLIVAITKMIA